MTVSPFDLSGRVAVVTGSGSGIGRSLALGLGRAGAHVVVVDADPAAMTEAAASMAAEGIDVLPLRADVRVAWQVDELVRTTVLRLGSLDVLVNNVGGTAGSNRPAEEVAPEDWTATMDLCATSTFLCARSAGRQMIEQRRGAIINIASLYGLVAQDPNLYDPHPDGGQFQLVAYTAAKGAVVALTRALAVAWAPHGITVNALAPGHVRTSRNAGLGSVDFWSRLAERTPLGRVASPEDMAGTAVYLASRAADFVTGQVIAVDGGWSAS